MPHSSGGGSHGGGGHHGGSHGGSHGPSPTRISSAPYPGARRFRYRTRRGYRYFYTTREPGRIFRPARLLTGLFYIPFIAAGLSQIAAPIKRAAQKYDREIVVIDDAFVLEDQSKLMTSLNAFSDRTQITPAVITLYNEDWQNRYATLESYAYDRYLAEFNDEYHWLIVYSQPREIPPAEDSAQSSYVDWYWEGMQGDYTDPVLTDYVTGQFNNVLQSSLEAGEAPVADSLASAFDAAASTAGTLSRKPQLSEMSMGLFVLAFVAFHAYFMLGLNELKYRKAELDPDDPGMVPDPASRFSPQPTGMQQSFGTPQTFGTPQPTDMQQSFGTPQTFGTPQPTGMQQSFGTPQTFGMPQPTGMQQPAPAPAMQSLEMPELLAEPPKDESSSFVIPQFETPQFDLPQSDTPQFDAQQRQFDLQQEQFAQQQRQFDMHQQQFGMPAPQPAAPAFGIPEFPQPSAQPAKETCRYCGMQYFSGIKYCPGCGAEVSDNPG